MGLPDRLASLRRRNVKSPTSSFTDEASIYSQPPSYWYKLDLNRNTRARRTFALLAAFAYLLSFIFLVLVSRTEALRFPNLSLIIPSRSRLETQTGSLPSSARPTSSDSPWPTSFPSLWKMHSSSTPSPGGWVFMTSTSPGCGTTARATTMSESTIGDFKTVVIIPLLTEP